MHFSKTIKHINIEIPIFYVPKIEYKAEIQTLKRMLSVAKRLAENESSEIFELGHHIADNVLNKICMLVALEMDQENLIYEYVQDKYPKGKRGPVKSFEFLYRNILEKNYRNVPKYDDLIKKYHRDRNTYNHDIISLNFSIRKPLAMIYIEHVEGIMREIGYLEKDEPIESSTLISHSSVKDLNLVQKEISEQKFKKFYQRLAVQDPDHIIIDVRSLIEDIGKIDFEKILRMDYSIEDKERILIMEHQKWTLSIRSGPSGHLRLMKYVLGNSETYDFELPHQNEVILIEFLNLIRDRCKDQGIFI